MTETALAHNVIEFGRLLRRAGLPVGPADMLAALRATLIHRHEQHEVFDQAFDLFWRDPAGDQFAALMALMNEKAPKPEQRQSAGSRRVAEAFSPKKQQRETEDAPELDATLTVSASERLQTMDFEAMSAAEISSAQAEIRRLRLPLDARRTRRTRPNPRGALIDMAATLRAGVRTGGEMLGFAHAARVVRPPPLVVLCDISGSMTRYAQVLLHFLHAVANDRDRVSVFLFGTRLSNITRQLRHRDPETAFAEVAALVRRLLGQGAVVLLVTDGLDREGARGLSDAMDRLHRSCRRLIWLNPLLRWDGFEPRSQGIRAILPHVDEFRPVHNLASLRALIATLSGPGPGRGRPMVVPAVEKRS